MNLSIIKSSTQYDKYCDRLMKLDSGKPSKKSKEEMELLELLVEKWENDQLTKKSLDPVELLEYLMENHNISRNDLIELLGIQKSALSQILSYKKGFSKEVIRKLAETFKLSQEAFNRKYPLRIERNKTSPKRRTIAA